MHKATIIPRGRALGMVMQLPERDQLSMSFEQMTSRLAIMMGGRVAEEHDLRQGQGHLGRRLATSSRRRGSPAPWSPAGASPTRSAASRSARTRKRSSSATPWRATRTSRRRRAKIDHEVRRLVEEGYEEARRILTEHKDDLETLARACSSTRPCRGDEIKDLLKGKPPVREDPSEDNTPPRGSAVPATGHRKPRPDKGGDTGLEPQPAT